MSRRVFSTQKVGIIGARATLPPGRPSVFQGVRRVCVRHAEPLPRRPCLPSGCLAAPPAGRRRGRAGGRGRRYNAALFCHQIGSAPGRGPFCWYGASPGPDGSDKSAARAGPGCGRRPARHRRGPDRDPHPRLSVWDGSAPGPGDGPGDDRPQRADRLPALPPAASGASALGGGPVRGRDGIDLRGRAIRGGA